MTISSKCDVQVVKYRSVLVSQSANHLKLFIWSVVHLIRTADSQFHSPTMYRNMKLGLKKNDNLFKCDVQVVKYRSEVLSSLANHLKVCFWSVVHLILTANSQFLSPP